VATLALAMPTNESGPVLSAMRPSLMEGSVMMVSFQILGLLPSQASGSRRGDFARRSGQGCSRTRAAASLGPS
jgi:hypothetical protein